MKKLIYEVFLSKRDGGDSYANIYDDGSYDITITHAPPPYQGQALDGKTKLLYVEFIKLAIEGRLSYGLSCCDYFSNPRYKKAYRTLVAVTERGCPFEGFRIVYHGKGKPWVRVFPEGTYF